MPGQLSGVSANQQDGARLDVAANGVWGGGRYEKTHLDVRIVNPHAPSNRNQGLAAMFTKHEREKRKYEQRIREVEHSTFTLLVLAVSGGMANQATTFYKCLASLLWDSPYYSTTLNWLRCRLCFSLLRSSIQAIRGARSPGAIDLVTSESQIQAS